MPRAHGRTRVASVVKRIEWPDLKFPPINLWVVASLPSGWSPVSADKAARTHRRQRPGVSAKRPNALQKNIQRRLESILAVRGGKR